MGTIEHVVDPSNGEQARAWDGNEGAYWAERAEAFDRSVAAYDRALLDAAAVRPGAEVLDVGCGTGHVTRAVGRSAAPGTATGIDLSGPMIEVARAAGGAAYVQGDAQVHPFPAGAYDLVVSRTGAMFFGDPDAAFANLRRALRPGGRLVLLVWQTAERNEWIGAVSAALTGRALSPPPGAPGPFSLGEPERVRSLLGGAGFAGITVTGVREPMDFGPDAGSAYGFLTGLLGWMVAGLDSDRRAAALAALRRDIEAHATPAGVRYGSAAWLVTATAG